jgi:hypothetical protein
MWRFEPTLSTIPQLETAPPKGHSQKDAAMPAFFSIMDLAERWRCSRGTIYNLIRGERVVDFAAPGRKGKKIVPAETVRRIEERRTRVFR